VGKKMRVKFSDLHPSDRKGSNDAVVLGHGKVIIVNDGAQILKGRQYDQKDKYGLPIEHEVEIEIVHEGPRSKVAEIVRVVNLDEERRARIKGLVEQEKRGQEILLRHFSATASEMGLSFEEGEKEDSRSVSVRIEGVWVKITQFDEKIFVIPAQKVLYTNPQTEDFQLRMTRSETIRDFVGRIMKESSLWAEWEERVEGLALEKGLALESASLRDNPKFPRSGNCNGMHFDFISGEMDSINGERFAFTFKREEGKEWELSSWVPLESREEITGLPHGSYSTVFGGLTDR
jgi:hypothetical protein